MILEDFIKVHDITSKGGIMIQMKRKEQHIIRLVKNARLIDHQDVKKVFHF